MAFEDLEVWKKSARMSADLYREFSSLKDFGFKDQITRSGLSIPSNISEGHERASAKENMNFLNYAKGSCGELRTQIYIGMEIGYIPPEKGKLWLKETETISAMIGGLIRNKKTLIESKKQKNVTKTK
jgi:four helix bundle protein